MPTPSSNGSRRISFLVLSASLRHESWNTRLARVAAETIEAAGGAVQVTTMAEFDAPSCDQDVQDGVGFPPGAERFRQRLQATDAFVIAPPEYNASLPGALKNAIDWVSRFRPQPIHQRQGLLMSASPSMVAPDGRRHVVPSTSAPGTASTAGTSNSGHRCAATTTDGPASATMPARRWSRGDAEAGGKAGITGPPARNPAKTATT